MKVNRSVPPPTVVPVLVYPDVRAAVTFLTAAFGFVERTRIGESHRAQLAVGEDGAVIIADGGGDRRASEPGGFRDVALSPERLAPEEQVAHSIPLVLVVLALDAARRGGLAGAGIGQQLLARLIHTHQRSRGTRTSV